MILIILKIPSVILFTKWITSSTGPWFFLSFDQLLINMDSDENHCCLRYVDVVKDYSKQNVFVCLPRHHRSYKKYQ